MAKEIGAGPYAEAVKLQADLVCKQPLIAPFSEESCIAYQNTIAEVFEELVATTDYEVITTHFWRRRQGITPLIRRWRVRKLWSIAPALTTSPVWLIAPKCWNDFASFLLRDQAGCRWLFFWSTSISLSISMLPMALQVAIGC